MFSEHCTVKMGRTLRSKPHRIQPSRVPSLRGNAESVLINSASVLLLLKKKRKVKALVFSLQIRSSVSCVNLCSWHSESKDNWKQC